MIPLTVPEVRRLLCRLVWNGIPPPEEWPGPTGADGIRPPPDITTGNDDWHASMTNCNCSIKAHAWVELADQVVNDRPDAVAVFTPLTRRVPFGDIFVSGRDSGRVQWQ